jgi:hypothetical protein
MSTTALHDLRPQRRNANRHTPRGMGALEQSIKQDGWIGAITVAADGETFDGSARIEVGVSSGFEEAIVVESAGDRPVIVKRTDIPTADDPRAVRLGLAANRVASLNLDWNPEVLAELNKELDLKGLWNEEELREALAGLENGGEGGTGIGEGLEPELDRAEELKEKWGTSEGQIWQLGRHLIACLDCKDEGNITRVFPGTVNFVWADPPYGLSIVATNGYVGGGEAYDIPFGGVKKQRGNVGGGEGIKARTGLYPIQMRGQGLGTVGGAKPFGSQAVRGSDRAAHMIGVGKYAPVIGDDTTDTAEASSRLLLSLYPKATHVWWGANYYAHVLPPSSCWIVWDKENTGNFADAELAWCSDTSAVRIFKHMWNGLMKDSERGVRRVHPTQKPVALAAWAFEKYGAESDVILDPFLGSGISVIAAEQLPGARTVVGFELSPAYIAVCLERWKTCTAQEPRLL